MAKVSILTLMAFAILAAAGPALAGPYAADPDVMPGIGPRGPVARASAVERPGRLGGGFIEFLMTGQSGSARQAMVNPVYPAEPGYAPEPDYGAAPQPVAPMVPQPGYAMPRKAMDPVFMRQEVPYAGRHAAGTVVIDTANKFLYLVEGEGQALRYGIGVGRPGFLWAGEKTITRKAEWPGWTPPVEMLKRRPDLPGHMDGGIANPLGARAMYLGSTLYRIHGTNEPDTIGTNVSSGCIRLTNDDVSDLYGRVKVGTRVVVM